MTYTDEQCTQFYAAITGTTEPYIQSHQFKYAQNWLKRLTAAGFTIEFPVKVEYRVTPLDGRPVYDRRWRVDKYINNKRAEWIGDFNNEVHAEDMRDLLTNDLNADGQDIK